MTRGGRAGAGAGADQRFSDLGFIPDKYCLACSVMSRLGRVFPQAIMFHLTSSCNIKMMSEDVTRCRADDSPWTWGRPPPCWSCKAAEGCSVPPLLVKFPTRTEIVGNNFIVRREV